MAENAKLIADGALMDRNLTHEKLEEVSQALAKQIKILVPTGNKAYVAASRQYRQEKGGLDVHNRPWGQQSPNP